MVTWDIGARTTGSKDSDFGNVAPDKLRYMFMCHMVLKELEMQKILTCDFNL